MFSNPERILIVGGNSKNVGKTTFICSILDKYANQNQIIVIKFQKSNQKTFSIYEEKTLSTYNTNTYKYLLHKAYKSYLIKYNPQFLKNAINDITLKIDNNSPIIIESNSILNQLNNINNVVAIISNNTNTKPSTSILTSKSILIINVTPFFANFVELSAFLKKEASKIILTDNKWFFNDRL